MNNIYTIFVADRNKSLLEGLVAIINQEKRFEVVGTACSARELAASAVLSPPDLFLLDIDLADGIGWGFSVKTSNPAETSKTILLTEHWEHSLIKRIVASGVKGCLKKTCDAGELIFAMNRVLEGETYFSGYHDTLGSDQIINLKDKKRFHCQETIGTKFSSEPAETQNRATMNEEYKERN